MKEYVKSGVLGTAAMKAGMHREMAAKHVAAGQGPQSEKQLGRRRPNPLTTIWPGAERLLSDAPELEAKALFEHLLAGGAAPEAQKALHTFQRLSTANTSNRSGQAALSHANAPSHSLPRIMAPI